MTETNETNETTEPGLSDAEALALLHPPEGSGAEPEPEPVRPDPEATRRPWVAGVPVALRDGRVWHLAAPTIRYQPRFIDGRVELEIRHGYPVRAQHALDRLVAAVQQDRENVPLSLVFGAALGLLLVCHDVLPAAVCPELEVDAEGLAALVEAVMKAVAGEGADVAGPEPEPDPIPMEFPGMGGGRS